MYFTYIIRCKDDSLYTGYTTDIDRRMKEHENGVNCKYSKVKGFKNLETYFIADSKSSAMKLECYIKKLHRNKNREINRRRSKRNNVCFRRFIRNSKWNSK